MDMMHLTPSSGYKYIVQARCLLTHWPEWDMLRKESAKLLATFILHNIIYRWGTLLEIVMDNGAPFVKALGYLAKHFHLTHIRISGYNSRANGIVERSHFDVRQALFKACDGDQTKWSTVFGFLGRARNSSLLHGLLSIFCDYWYPPTPPL